MQSGLRGKDTTFGLLVAPVPGDAVFDKQRAALLRKEYSEPGVLDGIEPTTQVSSNVWVALPPETPSINT